MFLYGKKGFYAFYPTDLSYDEPGFSTVLEYLDIEAKRSKILLSSTKQGKIVNEICLKIQESLNDYNFNFGMNIEAIYRMAVLKLIVESAAIDQVLMPMFKKHRDIIAEVEIFPWTSEDVIVLVFIDNVFEELVPDEAIFLFEYEENERWLIKPLEEELPDYDESFDDDDDDIDDEYYVPEDYVGDEDEEPYNHDNTKEMLRDFMPRNDCYLINQIKMDAANEVFHRLCEILNKSNAKYTIEFLDDGLGWAEIQIVTDAFDPNDCNDTIDSYRYIVNNVDLIRQNVYNGKIVMTFTIRDVYVDLRRVERE